jgi:uncharacterized protein (DUF58 family)
MAVAAGILGIWWLVAHNGGAGWVQALGDVVFGTLVIGIFAPFFVLARAQVRVAGAPADGTVGQPVSVLIASSTRLRIRVVDPAGDPVFIGPVRRHRSPDDRVTLVPIRRGVHDALEMEIATAAPFALQWWTRRVVVDLPSPLHVAPRRGRAQPFDLRAHEASDEASNAWAQADAGQPRGIRPYAAGDNRRQVHWRATAHTGELMVRELERPAAERRTLTVVLPEDREEAERVAERALGTLVVLLDGDTPVLLATVETSGPVVALVADRRAAGRRLARAVARPADVVRTAGPHPGP